MEKGNLKEEITSWMKLYDRHFKIFISLKSYVDFFISIYFSTKLEAQNHAASCKAVPSWARKSTLSPISQWCVLFYAFGSIKQHLQLYSPLASIFCFQRKASFNDFVKHLEVRKPNNQTFHICPYFRRQLARFDSLFLINIRCRVISDALLSLRYIDCGEKYTNYIV